MAQNTRLAPYGEHTVEQPDDIASDPEFGAYGPTPSMANKDYFLHEDIPLFLSSDAVTPRQRGFGSGGERSLDRPVVWSRFLKAGILVTSAAGIAFAIVSIGNPLSLLGNAKASLIGIQSETAARPASEPVAAVLQASSQPAPGNPSTVSIGTSPPAAKAAPTRDEIALALKAAHQNQTEVHPPAAVTAAPPPARRLDADELATLLSRAKSLIAIGDIAPARLLLERAADAQEASAALLLAQTYDPAVLGTPDARSITADPAKARDWYRKAVQFGSQEAQLRLSQIQN